MTSCAAIKNLGTHSESWQHVKTYRKTVVAADGLERRGKIMARQYNNIYTALAA